MLGKLSLFLLFQISFVISTKVEDVYQEQREGGREETEIQEVLALYDDEADVIFYKDPSFPACFVQNLGHDEDISGITNIILHGDAMNETLPMYSRFQKEFCSNLPILKMDETSPPSKSRRVHRNRRRRNAYRQQYQSPGHDGRGVGRQQQRHYWPGSQAHVQGNVAGNGYFSGQAQSLHSGLSQSQLELGGVGLTGSISSVAGGSLAGLRLGMRSGSGQISSSGMGSSASDLHLNLGEQGQESRARAMVMQEQHQSNGVLQQRSHQNGAPQFQGSLPYPAGQFQNGQSTSSGQRQTGFRQQYFPSKDLSSPQLQPVSQTGYGSQNNFERGYNYGGSGGGNQPLSSQAHQAFRGTGENGNQPFNYQTQQRFQGNGDYSQTRQTGAQSRRVGDGTNGFAHGGISGLHDSTKQSPRINGHGFRMQTHTDQSRTPSRPSTPAVPVNAGGLGRLQTDSVKIREEPKISTSTFETNHRKQTAHQIQPTDKRYPISTQPRSESQQYANGFNAHRDIPQSTDERVQSQTQYSPHVLQSVQNGVQGSTNDQTQHKRKHVGTPSFDSTQNLQVQQPRPQINPAHVQRHETGQPRFEPSQGATSQHQTGQTQTQRFPASSRNGYQSEDILLRQRTQPQQQYSQNPEAAMGTYPNGRRVYQRRIVTYYPGQVSPAAHQQSHYLQQTMTGSQPQRQNKNQIPSVKNTGHHVPRCQLITFTCTIIFDTNGKSKLCQPKPTNGKSNGHANICCC